MKRKGFMKGVSSKFNVCIRRQIVLVQIFATDEKRAIQLMIWRCVQMFRKKVAKLWNEAVNLYRFGRV
jgi:hypothetical protein